VKYHYVWLLWSSAFLVPWTILYVVNSRFRVPMMRASLWTGLLGFTEPLFVPAYWSPPSLFDLTQRTGFDVESVIYAFAIGGIGSALYDTITRQHLAPASDAERARLLHRFHLAALFVPFVASVPLLLLRWNPIYPVITSFLLGAIASVVCRPGLRTKTVVGGLLFLAIYAVFMLGLKWLAPGYIGAVWNVAALNWGEVFGIPAEELAFGASFGLYWTGVYEHFTWSESVPHVPRGRTGGDFRSTRVLT
jgi:hypothetical protein